MSLGNCVRAAEAKQYVNATCANYTPRQETAGNIPITSSEAGT